MTESVDKDLLNLDENLRLCELKLNFHEFYKDMEEKFVGKVYTRIKDGRTYIINSICISMGDFEYFSVNLITPRLDGQLDNQGKIMCAYTFNEHEISSRFYSRFKPQGEKKDINKYRRHDLDNSNVVQSQKGIYRDL